MSNQQSREVISVRKTSHEHKHRPESPTVTLTNTSFQTGNRQAVAQMTTRAKRRRWVIHRNNIDVHTIVKVARSFSLTTRNTQRGYNSKWPRGKRKKTARNSTRRFHVSSSRLVQKGAKRKVPREGIVRVISDSRVVSDRPDSLPTFFLFSFSFLFLFLFLSFFFSVRIFLDLTICSFF